MILFCYFSKCILMSNKINIKNKKAWHDYHFIEKYTAGMELTGTEIKSVRLGKASLADSYCFFENGELWVKGLHIAEYSRGSYYNHDPKRNKKLLLTKRELKKLKRGVREKGYTIIALRLFIAESGYAKLEIALSRGKREYDKREDLKKREAQRELDRLRKKSV
jgi:SsrA-binding protein